ncbi:MAG: ribosome silencing factor [Lentisphaeria bacterium]|nr:ribosome silencing factor [Lentisphaeria bacterium]NQZ66616.1 ribosome silencing factor [Lentisphaeria bacterium]
MSTSQIEGEKLVDYCIESCENSLAIDLVVYDVRGISVMADFYLFCTGRTFVQTRAILNNLSRSLKKDHSLLPKSTEGTAESGWVLLDLRDVLVHIFNEDKREFYDIDELHIDTPIYYQAAVEEEPSE